MRFLHPLGLLGLIGVPVIILIYILQSKYNEQTVTSTYLWHLSEKFLKRRNPLSGITGLISLILQILTVVAVSLIIAHPIFTLPNAAGEYYFVLDASGSMSMTEGKETRFDRAKDEIIDVIKDSKSGSSYTLVCVSGETEYTFSEVRSKEAAIDLVRELEPRATHATYENTLRLAQSAFDDNTAALVYLVTDKGYETHENIEIISVGSKDVKNFAVFNAVGSHAQGKLKVTADVYSYVSDETLEIALYVDGERAQAKKLDVVAGEAATVEFSCSCEGFSTFDVRVENADGYAADNMQTVHNLKTDKAYSTLIVSETGFFFEAVIESLVDSTVRVVSPEQYASVKESYGLYIFDSYTPDELPDGSVWLINTDVSIEKSGFGVRGKVSLPKADKLEKSTHTSTTVRKLLEGIRGTDIYVGNYVKYSGMYLNFATLFTYDGSPLIFAGTNGLGNRQVVFGFSLHDSDFALSTDFLILVRNLLSYSFPDVIEETSYTVGDEAVINIVAGMQRLKALSPSGKDIYVETEGTMTALTLDEVGTYEVSVTVNGTESTYRLYAAAHPSESEPVTTEGDFSLSGERTYANIDGEYDPTVLLILILALLFLADWGVYCYEKYQLR